MDEIKLLQFKEKLELRGYASRTIEEYCNYMSQFKNYLEEQENINSFDKVKPEHLNAFHAHLHYTKGSKATFLSVGSVRLRLAALKTFYRVMFEERLVKQNYAPSIALPNETKNIPSHVPTEKDMIRFLDSVIPNTPLRIRNRCIVEILYATGIRNEELCTLTLSSIDLNEKSMRVKGKGSKERLVPIGDWVLPYLKEYLLLSRPKLVSRNRFGNNRFFVSKTGRNLVRSSIGYLVRVLSKKVGLPYKVTPHSFRHACATHLLKAGADIRYVQELLGHELLSTTQIYTKVEISFLKKIHKQYHPRERQLNE